MLNKTQNFSHFNKKGVIVNPKSVMLPYFHWEGHTVTDQYMHLAHSIGFWGKKQKNGHCKWTEVMHSNCVHHMVDFCFVFLKPFFIIIIILALVFPFMWFSFHFLEGSQIFVLRITFDPVSTTTKSCGWSKEKRKLSSQNATRVVF